MKRLDFIIYHSNALCRDWASLYIILPLYAETGLRYISFCRSIPRLDFIIYHSVDQFSDWTTLYIILLLISRLGFNIYHSTALCRDWATLFIILPPNVETGLHYISFHPSL